MSQRAVALQEALLFRVQSGFILSALITASEKKCSMGSLLRVLVLTFSSPLNHLQSLRLFHVWRQIVLLFVYFLQTNILRSDWYLQQCIQLLNGHEVFSSRNGCNSSLSEFSKWKKILIYTCYGSSVMIRRWQQQQLHHLFSPEPEVSEAWVGLGRQRGTA